jgi:hypothetical protein
MKRVHGKTLVLCLDEMERLSVVGPDSILTFVTGFTRFTAVRLTSWAGLGSDWVARSCCGFRLAAI